jgi:hypothetical protein
VNNLVYNIFNYLFRVTVAEVGQGRKRCSSFGLMEY